MTRFAPLYFRGQVLIEANTSDHELMGTTGKPQLGFPRSSWKEVGN